MSIFSRLTFQRRIFLFVGTFVVLSLLLTWFVIRPGYERSVIEERITVIQQIQHYAVSSMDKSLEEWINISRYLAWQAEQRPGEIDVLMRQYIALNPDIVQIVVSSPTESDELVVTNSLHPKFSFHPSEQLWSGTKIDSTDQMMWSGDSIDGCLIFGSRKNFTSEGNTFSITLFVNTHYILHELDKLPVGGEYTARIENEKGIVYQNSNRLVKFSLSEKKNVSVLKSEIVDGKEWKVISTEFSTIPFIITIGIPQETIVKPVQQLFLFSSLFIGIITTVILFLGWIVSRQISKPVGILVKDVERLSLLDFSQPISPLSLPELERIGTTIESMRVVLERYKRINVEKIIFEEWKSKFFMSHSEDSIAITGVNDEFVFMNDRFQKLKHDIDTIAPFSSKENVLSHPLIKRSKETTREEHTDNFFISFTQVELEVQLPEAETQFYRLQDVAIKREGEVLGSMLILHDLTEERLMERMKTEMMNFIVHELRNPLNSIMGFASLILDDPEMGIDDRTEFISIISEASKTMNRLVNRFLDVSRLESRKVEYVKELTDLVTVAKNLCDSQKPQLLAKNIELKFFAEDGIPDVVVSPDLMREAFLNLISNAIKYGDENRVIEIEMKKIEENIIFIITDHGYGISAGDQQRLFSKFFRVTSNKKAASQIGTGLGLAHVKEVMKYHGGDVALESNAEIGCRFTLTLPIQ